MHKFLTRVILALALLVSSVAVLPKPAAAATAYYTTVVKTLLPSAARTATTTGTAVTTSISTQPVLSFNVAVAAAMTVYLNVTVATSGTLDLTVEGSLDNSTFYTLSPLTGGSSAAWTQVTTSTSKQVRNFAGPLPPYIRAVGTQASTPVHTYSVQAVFGG